MQRFQSFLQALAAVAFACSPLEPDGELSAGESCDVVGASRCAARAGKGLLYCDDGEWRAAPCPGRQVCTSENAEAACRDPVEECANQPEGTRFCRGNVVHACSVDWVNSSVETTCEEATPVCLRGVCVPCQPDSRRCSPSAPHGPQLCSADGVWLDESPCAAPTGNCVFGRCERFNNFGTACHTADNALYEVQWVESEVPPSYQVRSIGGSRSARGWLLHHRPPIADDPFAYFIPDSVTRDDAIVDVAVPRTLIPSASVGPLGANAPLSILTCPDGTCVASPVTRECKTVYPLTGLPATPRPRRIAVIGDELLRENQTCKEPLPDPDDDCAPTLEQVLRGQGYASWIAYQDAPATAYSWLHVAREQATTRPDLLVIAVATHEALRLAALPDLQRTTQLELTVQAVYAAIDALRAQNANAKVVLVTTTERGPPDYSGVAKALNDRLWKIRDEDKYVGHVIVAGWQTVVTQNCGAEWPSPTGPKCKLFDDDQLHLRGLGDSERNRFIAFAIYYAFNPLPPVQNRLE